MVGADSSLQNDRYFASNTHRLSSWYVLQVARTGFVVGSALGSGSSLADL